MTWTGTTKLATGKNHFAFIPPFNASKPITFACFQRGPLSWDGRRTVDWQLLLAIVLVISLNVHDHISYVEPCPHVLHPVGFSSSRPYTSPGFEGRDPIDWAGITGNWRRLVSFCDHRDLQAFNARCSITLGRCSVLTRSSGTTDRHLESLHRYLSRYGLR
jgi:hypothetical protein